MCLNLINDKVTPKTAETDIVCYKRLRVTKGIANMRAFHGKEFTARMGKLEVSGIISIYKGSFYFCTDHSNLDGNECPNKFGKKYSWVHDGTIRDVYVDSKKLDFEKDTCYETPYMGSMVVIGRKYRSRLQKAGNTIEEGLHSFKHLEDAKNDGGGYYVKCIIPAGSKYYEGVFDGAEAYASNKIKYVRLVE